MKSYTQLIEKQHQRLAFCTRSTIGFCQSLRHIIVNDDDDGKVKNGKIAERWYDLRLSEQYNQNQTKNWMSKEMEMEKKQIFEIGNNVHFQQFLKQNANMQTKMFH